jgi:hypothetical protein
LFGHRSSKIEFSFYNGWENLILATALLAASTHHTARRS